MSRKCRGDYAGGPKKRSVEYNKKIPKYQVWVLRLTAVSGADERGQYPHGDGKKKNSLGKAENALGER